MESSCIRKDKESLQCCQAIGREVRIIHHRETLYHCIHCQSDVLGRNGHAPNGKQLYRCRACGRQSRENPTPHVYPQTRREEILHAYQERSSLRGLTRTFGVSRTTISSWIKKK
jgi:transposase-like protein